MPEQETLLYAADSAYIDPVTCDSTLSYKVYDDGYSLNGSVQIGDCVRKTEWSFNDDEASLDKIDLVINMLTTFRGTLKKAQNSKRVKDRKKEVEAKAAARAAAKQT